jgi:hypothetical protein
MINLVAIEKRAEVICYYKTILRINEVLSKIVQLWICTMHYILCAYIININ